jgi:hypothetical protein
MASPVVAARGNTGLVARTMTGGGMGPTAWNYVDERGECGGSWQGQHGGEAAELRLGSVATAERQAATGDTTTRDSDDWRRGG